MNDPREQLVESLLVMRAQLGEAAAFEDLVQRYHQRLLFYLRRLADPKSDAEGILQDVWLTAWRKLGQLQSPGAFKPWLFTIARRKAFRVTQNDRRTQPLSAEEIVDAREDDSPFTADDVEALHEAVASLSVEQREAVVLRYFEQMSYEQISAVVGCPVGTIRSRLHHAKNVLRRKLGAMSDE